MAQNTETLLADYSVWVHGTAGLSDQAVSVNRFASGAEFISAGPADTNIIFPIPTPVIMSRARLRLVHVFLLYALSPGATLKSLSCWDGYVNLGLNGPDPSDAPAFNTNIIGPVSHLGGNGFSDFELVGVTRFDLSIPVALKCGLALVASVEFNENSSIIFSSVGADFVT